MFLKKPYRLFPVFRADHQVPRLFQNALVELSDQGIVFGQKDGLLPSPVGGLLGICDQLRLLPPLATHGKVDLKVCSLLHFAVDIDDTVVLLDNPVDRGES